VATTTLRRVALSHMTDQIGRVLNDRYRIRAPIGSGSSAQVFLADDVRLRRRVAVKVLHPSLANDEGFLRRFEAEARASGTLNHAHILAVYDWGEDAGPYLVGEFCEGGSLRNLLDSGYLLSIPQAHKLALEAARALDHAHGRGLVHRDIKPANLLFDDDGSLRIADFGLARALAEAASTEPTGALLGTARYSSPEQARGEPVGEKGDVYSLALTMVEAVTGEVPFALDTPLGTLTARMERSMEVPATLGPLWEPMADAGRLDPVDRSSASELVTSLLAIAGDIEDPEPLPVSGALDLSEAEIVVDPDPTMLPDPEVLPPPDATPTGVAAPSGAGGLTRALRRARGGAIRGLRRTVAAARRRSTRRIALAVVVVLALLAAGGILVSRLLRPSHDVPELAGLRIAQVDPLVDGFHWDIQQVGARAAGSQPGEVLEQDPAPGDGLREGSTLTLTVSRGEELAAVPEVDGLTVAEATAAMDGAGLRVGPGIPKFSEFVAEGVVIAPTTIFTELPAGSIVPVTVSLGPRPRVVPEVAGSSFDAAAAALADVQLVAVRAEEHSTTVPEGEVIRSDPAAGTEVDRDGEVAVVVSIGPPPVDVPDVVGRLAATAADRLEAAGLVVTDVDGPPNRPVCATDPPPGTTVEHGSEVTLATRC